MKKAPKAKWLSRIGAVLAVLSAFIIAFTRSRPSIARFDYGPSTPPPVAPALGRIVTGDGSVATNDIALLNLACAEGLPGTQDLDVNEYLKTLDEIAIRVRGETERHLYRFKQNPAEFDNSEAFFRMLMLTVVLAEDFKITYDPARKAGPMTGDEGDRFFADASNVFVHGLLGPKRQGTCSSMPVLYVAVGRRLGYPLKLVTTKGHLFVRWEGSGERFNVEATSHGLNRFDDDYYRHWPFEISATEEAAEGYLKSLSPAEELGVFLSIRGMCMREAGRIAEAAECFASAAKHAPGCASYRAMAEQLRSKAAAAVFTRRT